MIFVFNKRLLIAVSATLFFLLIVAASQSRIGSPYAIYGNTWEGVGAGKDYHSKNMVYSVVSVPGGTRTQQPQPLGYFSPDSQTAIVDGFFGHDGIIRRVWTNIVETFHFKYYVERPPFWSPDSKSFAISVATRGCDDCQG